MKKITFVLLASIILYAWGRNSSCQSLAAEANLAYYTAKITADSVNLRSGPGTNFEILRKINKGELVLVLGKKLDWYKIELPRNTRAFIHSEFIGTKSLIYGEINADNVNVRAGEGTNFNVIGQLNKGDAVEILERGKDWYHIYPYKNCFAWAHKDYLKKEGPAKIYTDKETHHREGWKLLYKAENFEIANKQAALKNNDLSAILQKYNTIVRNYPKSMASIRAQRHIDDLKRIKSLLKKKQPGAAAAKKQIQDKKPAAPAGIDTPTEKPIVRGKIMDAGRFFKRPGTHKLLQNGKTKFFLKSQTVNINDFVYHDVLIWGKIISNKKSRIPVIEVTFIKKTN